MNMQAQATPAGLTTLPAGLDLEAMADEAQQAWQVAAAAGKDSRALAPGHRAAALASLCRALHLNPLTNPLIYVTLNGKEVLYVTRQATDQIAARLGLHRDTVEGPEVRDFAGTKLLYCKVRVTMPGTGGRSETAVATLQPTDLVNAVMKVETKAKRRATLSMVGLGMMGEDDVEGAAGWEIPVSNDEPTESQSKLSLDLADCTVNRDAAEAWLRHRDAITRDGDDVRKASHGEVVKVLMRLMETTKTAADKYLRTVIAERDGAIRAARATEVKADAPVEAKTEEASDPPDANDYAAQLSRCDSLDAIANLYRGARAELAKSSPADKAAAWTATIDRLAEVMRAPSTQGLGALLKKRVAELDGPTDPTPPTGTDAPPANDPAASAHGDAVAATQTAGAQAIRTVLDTDMAHITIAGTWRESPDQWAAHLASKHTRREVENSIACNGAALGPAYIALAAERIVAIDATRPKPDGVRALTVIGVTQTLERLSRDGSKARAEAAMRAQAA